jgi:hypothetical protein
VTSSSERSLWLQLLVGPVGGFLVSALGFFLFEMWFRRRRERRDLAIGLAAELELAAERIHALLADPDKDEIPSWFSIPTPIYSAVPARLGELPFGTVKQIGDSYSQLDGVSRMGPLWRERALTALSLPPAQQAIVFRELAGATKEFYAVLISLESDCRNLSGFLQHSQRTLWQKIRLRDFKRAVLVPPKTRSQ